MKLKRTHITILWIVAAVVMLSLILITTRKQSERVCTGITVIMENSSFGCVLDEDLVMKHLLKDKDTITGKNIQDIDLVRLRKHILKLPWISDADIYFTLHGILKIRVQQRSVIARLFDRHGATAYLGSDGMLMPVSAHSEEPVLVVSGEINDSLRKYTGRNISEIKKCGSFSRAKGLMFSRRENAKALLFEFPRSVKFHLTSLFVFFPFVVVWLDEENKVIEVRKIKPFVFEIPFSNSYRKILEIPVNKKYEKVLEDFPTEMRKI